MVPLATLVSFICLTLVPTQLVYIANTFDLPLSTLSALTHFRGTNSNRALVFILPPQGLPIVRNSTLHRIFFFVIIITMIL